MDKIILILFFIITGIHLYASFKQNKKLRNITKPFILILLLAWYLLVCKEPMSTMILALAFSWLGDVLLIGPGIKWFTAGGISFMVSHFFFILSYIQLGPQYKNLNVIPLLVLFFLIIVILIFRRLKPYLPKPIFIPMAFYLMINGGMNCAAICRMLAAQYTSNPIPAIITCIGAILFFISDSSLFFVRFKKDSVLKTHFLVMLTYSIGEFLIVLGMVPNIF